MLKQLSAIQILRYVWKGDLQRSTFVRIEKIFRDSPNRYHFITSTLEKDGSYDIHNCWVYSIDPEYDGPLYLCKGIKTQCDCERWKYTFEASQSMRNASDIIYSDGMLPYIRNPNFKISVCKHLIVALKHIIVNQM